MGKVGAWEVLEGRRQFLAKKRSPLEKIEGESWRKSILASDILLSCFPTKERRFDLRLSLTELSEAGEGIRGHRV